MADVSVEVARAVVQDRVRLEATAPKTFAAPAKGGVRLRYVYRFAEQSHDDETWTFRFSVRLGDGEPIVHEVEHKDRKGLHDHGVKNLHVDLPLKAGNHRVEYTAEARLRVLASNGARRQEEKVSGTLHIEAL